jgi:hypothetical protein
LLRQICYGYFFRIAQIDRACEVGRSIHEPDKAVNKIINIAKGPGLTALAVNGNVFTSQTLQDEIGDNPTVVGLHSGAVSVENAGNLYGQVMLPVVVRKKGLRTAFTFIVAGVGSNGIDIAPVGFRLGMHFRGAVYFGCGCLEDFGLGPFGQAQHVDGSVYRSFCCLYRVELIMNGRGGTGEVVDFIYLHIKGKSDIVAEKFKLGVVHQMVDIRLVAGVAIVNTYHFMAQGKKPFAKVGP